MNNRTRIYLTCYDKKWDEIEKVNELQNNCEVQRSASWTVWPYIAHAMQCQNMG